MTSPNHEDMLLTTEPVTQATDPWQNAVPAHPPGPKSEGAPSDVSVRLPSLLPTLSPAAAASLLRLLVRARDAQAVRIPIQDLDGADEQM
jgi:hypothetical protein